MKKRKIIYRGYKDPLIRLPKNRYGYEGVILEDANSGEIQCHICGTWHKHLASHIRWHHKEEVKIKGEKLTISYKNMFGIMHKTALCSKEIREKLIESSAKTPYWEMKRRIDQINKRGYRGKRINNKACAEKKNEEGLCFVQLLNYIKKEAIKLGRTPKASELKGSKGQNIRNTITRTYGSYAEALKLIKLIPNTAGGHRGGTCTSPLSREFLLQTLIDFEKSEGRKPSPSDTRNFLLPDIKLFEKEFGSLKKAIKFKDI